MAKINGPFNTVRLEGEIGNISKHIYIFFDFHESIQEQTGCDETTIDVNNYISNNVNNSKDTIDLFVEIYPSEISAKYTSDTTNTTSTKRGRYIDEVIKYYVKNINNKKNLRLHYFDIRDSLEGDTYYLLGEMASNAWNYGCSNNLLYEKQLAFLSDLEIRCNIIYDIVIKNKKYGDNSKELYKIMSEYKLFNIDVDMKCIPAIEYFINKIKKKINNNDIKKILNSFIESDIKKIINNTLEIIFNMKKLLIDIGSQNDNRCVNDYLDEKDYDYGFSVERLNKINKLGSYYDILKKKYVKLFVIIVDLFLLRRFLDKTYISTSVTYTGASHSIFYIYVLVKYFKFKVTHCSKTVDNLNIKQINENIQKADSTFNVSTMLLPIKLIQCSDLTSFPSNFD